MGDMQGPFPWLGIVTWAVILGVLFLACLGMVKLLSI